MKNVKEWIIAMCLMIVPGISDGQLPERSMLRVSPVEIIGLTVTPHVHIDPTYYKASDPFDSENGALIQLVVRNTGNTPVKFRLLFNGLEITDSRLIQEEGKPAYNSGQNIKNPAKIPEWTWCEMPEHKAYRDRDYELGAGKTDVFTYNSYREKWGMNYSYTVTVVYREEEAMETIPVRNDPNLASLEFISFLSDNDDSVYPDSAVMHIRNNTEKEYSIKKIRLYGPSENFKSDSTNGYLLIKEIDQLHTFTKNGKLPANGWSGFTCTTGSLPLVRGVVEVILQRQGKDFSLWAPIMFKKEQFDIGAGWLSYTSEKDSIYIPPLGQETFLKTLKRMHINVVHHNNVYELIPRNLQSEYFFKHMLNEFPAVYEHPEIYNTEEFVQKAERIDCLGEPNWGRTAMESYLITRRYLISETYPEEEWHIPTSVDHSMPQRIRYFAGISDYPAFDNYRITAPSDDRWRDYKERWGGGRSADLISKWGAPLETIGDITRTLHAVNKPVPIAGWSQNAHYGWGNGRKYRERISPTPDEIYAQAYQLLANGVTSLYWYSLEANSILRFRDVIDVTTRIGREVKMLEPFYISGAAYWYHRIDKEDNLYTPDLDLNVLITPDAALLFAQDLTYIPDTAGETASFRFSERIIKDVFFQLPGYLKDVENVIRVDADGVHNVSFVHMKKGIKIKEDSINICGIYLVCRDKKLIGEMEERRKSLMDMESKINFNPGTNPTDFMKLKNEMQKKPE